MSIITDEAELTAEWFTTHLGGNSGRVLEVSLTPMSIGAMCQMVRAELTWADAAAGPASVVVKFPTGDPGTLGLAKAMRMYELESRFYRDLRPHLPDVSVPACYLAEIDPDTDVFTVVMADLSGCTRPGDVLTECTPDECNVVLGELAALQCDSWDAPALQQMAWLADPVRTETLFDSIPQGLTPFLERFGSAISDEHVRLFEQVIPRAGDWIRSWSGPRVVQHGDLRSDNVLFGTDDTAAAATLVDFQTVRLGPPGVDPAYFLGSSLSVESRRSLEQDLLTDYHAALVAYGIDGFSADDCFRAYREGALYAVLLFCGLSVQVASSPRIDEVIANQTRRYADMAIDLASARLAGLA